LYAGGTYLGGMKAFGGSGIGGAGGLKNFGFQNFGKRLFNPTGTDGISNLLNPFRSTGGGKNYHLYKQQNKTQQTKQLKKLL
jgi:hypothetical protein